MSSRARNLLSAGTVNVIQCFYDSFLQSNAETRASAGLKTKIIRKTNRPCCDWCKALENTYDIDNAPDDIYGRHQNCDCTVVVVTEKGYTDAWSKKTYKTELEARKASIREIEEKQKNRIIQKAYGKEKENEVLRAGIKNKPRILRMPDEYIQKSVGAKSRNYDILDLGSGEVYNLVEGTKITDVEVFAGKGTKTIYRKAEEYAEEFQNNPAEWQHVKGKAIINFRGEERKAEIHWTQCKEFGKIDFFIKKWLD